MRPWPQSANEVVDAFGRPPPIHDAVVFRELVRVGGVFLVLRCFRHIPGGKRVEGLDEQRASKASQIAFNDVARFVRPDWPP